MMPIPSGKSDTVAVVVVVAAVRRRTPPPPPPPADSSADEVELGKVGEEAKEVKVGEIGEREEAKVGDVVYVKELKVVEEALKYAKNCARDIASTSF